MVRTDSREQKLDAFFKPPNQNAEYEKEANQSTNQIQSSSTDSTEAPMETEMTSTSSSDKRFDN
jgi:hypothetical protein